MARTKISIQLLSSGGGPEDQHVMLSGQWIKKWKIPTHQPLLLRFGSVRHQVKVSSSTHPSALKLSESLAKKLGLHVGAQLSLQYRPAAKTIAIGPLIGVMMSNAYPGAERLFGENTSFCKELVAACKLLGAFVFFFTTSDISSGYQTLNGWSYSGRWRKSVFPIPDVIYNRLTSRKLENKSSVQQLIREVKQRHGTIVFNEKYLNKNEVFDGLRTEVSLAKYLPESHVLRNYDTLKSMCAKYATVFLKPVTGSLGNGIIRISRLNGAYVCHFTTVTGSRQIKYANLPRLFKALTGKLKAQRHQIQQGIKLIRVGGRTVDFRATVQRSSQGGAWSVTSVVGRVAGPNQFVSNLARGGSLLTVKESLAKSSTSGVDYKSAYAQLRKAALEIAKGIETTIRGHFAELGIDLALDSSGRVWLLEVNSKPSKNDGTPLSEQTKIRPSVKQIVQYSRFVTGL